LGALHRLLHALGRAAGNDCFESDHVDGFPGDQLQTIMIVFDLTSQATTDPMWRKQQIGVQAWDG
jgi:hypothetical protein